MKPAPHYLMSSSMIGASTKQWECPWPAISRPFSTTRPKAGAMKGRYAATASRLPMARVSINCSLGSAKRNGLKNAAKIVDEQLTASQAIFGGGHELCGHIHPR